MSKQNKSAIILLKSRSYRANVKEAFHLFASNMKSFFLSLFPFPFFAGLVVAMLSVITRNVSNWLFWLSLCVAWIILVYLIAVFRQAFVYMLTDFGELQTIKKISWRKPEWKIFRQALPALLRRLQRRPAHRGRLHPFARPFPGRALYLRHGKSAR